jgi:hypothetical protein
MIIRTKNKEHNRPDPRAIAELALEGRAMIDLKAQGDQLVATHAFDPSVAMEIASHSRRYSDNGFTRSRTMRHIGEIPVDILVQHPEWMRDKKALKRWLRSEEGRPYRACEGRF